MNVKLKPVMEIAMPRYVIPAVMLAALVAGSAYLIAESTGSDAKPADAKSADAAQPKSADTADAKSDDTKEAPKKLEIETVKEAPEDAPVLETGDFAEVHYVGTLDDGKEFDSSRKRGETATFRIGKRNVIKGWDQGLPGMKEGEIRKLTIPGHLAYGWRGKRGQDGEYTIPPDATLHFEVELVKVHPGVRTETKKAGEGETAKYGDMVELTYTVAIKGKGAEGTLKSTEPVKIPLGLHRVVTGLEEGLVGAKAGETRVITVPDRLALEQGILALVPAGATLEYTVKINDIAPKVSWTVTKEGEGKTLGHGDNYAVHIVARIKDGKELGNTRERGQPLSGNSYMNERVPVPALDLGMTGMRVGETRTIEVAPAFAYGKRGVPGQIPENATLVYEVELLRADW